MIWRFCLPVRELSKVKHDLEVALTEVLINREEQSRTPNAQQQDEKASSSLTQQLVDAEEQVPSSLVTKHLMVELCGEPAELKPECHDVERF